MAAFLTMGLCALSRADEEPWPRVILRGDYPDPSILRDGADYYMTHSPFLYTPGFLIWHSKDLLHWKPVARAMNEVVGSAMAPDLVKHDGKYYIYFPAAGKNWVIWSTDVRGPWSKPVRLEVGMIDPGHVVDEQGKRWLFLSDGHRIRLSEDGLSLVGKLEKIYNGWDYPAEWKTEGKYLESPKLIRKDGWFHLLSAEGGTAGPATSHMVITARARQLGGPWENSPHNPIVRTWNDRETWWSKGHGTLIDDVNGNWWVVYHAYQNGFHTLGRQTLLEPVEWTSDGWVRAAKTAKPIVAEADHASQGMELSDDFSGKEPGLQWTAWRDYDPKSVVLKDRSLRLAGKGSTPADARLLSTTATDESYELQVEVTVDHGASGGLLLFYNEKAFAGAVSDGKQFTIIRNASESIDQPNSMGGHFHLKLVNRRNLCDFLTSGDGKTWSLLASGVDVSRMHHNVFKGFFALRPSLMAAGHGEVKFEGFQYRRIP